ncbi:hypothetical protein Veis_2579 [Verminephrobacter eiseniae EF01-2]|uniref:Uncharacterized protein n=1 Tax=Verminephrobacter eiseniae (strain EF01-2) TaxID=391735 RepID=A1WL17_VEREI|nr:hypothetical protein Veis_2579 [Verminephrobacter eiseniae EF01-2]
MLPMHPPQKFFNQGRTHRKRCASGPQRVLAIVWMSLCRAHFHGKDFRHQTWCVAVAICVMDAQPSAPWCRPVGVLSMRIAVPERAGLADQVDACAGAHGHAGRHLRKARPVHGQPLRAPGRARGVAGFTRRGCA